MKRLGWVLAAVLVAAACHSIDRGVFAQGPVPLDVLPLREPITYTVGPNAGQVVPTQHGLLASYFSGAAYVQPAYGEVLDHQQIDPNIDFNWDGSDTNPVIPVGGIDYGEGHPFRPDHWPIWSVVWEGYLEAPAEGGYVLSLHVNNGGWLEMKDASGALTTVISCPGGSGFEGDCPATVNMTAGRHYVRVSYYNNAPSAANAILSWQRPGESALSVVPTDALWTQATQPRRRAFMYVHGTTGAVNGDDFPSLLGRLERSYTRVNYRYYEDRRYGRPDRTCGLDEAGEPAQRSFPLTHGSIQAAFPFTIDPFEPAPGLCDSNDDIELNAVLLDADLAALQARFDGVTLIANSGGGTIIRSYLAYATAAGSRTLDRLDAVMILEGAQHGTYIAAAYNRAGLPNNDNPVKSTVRDAILSAVRDAVGHDPTRPAFVDLTPQSDLITFYSLPTSIPDGPHYVNVAGDVVARVGAQVFIFTVPAGRLELGDGVMLPGRDDPAQLPLPPDGGARFLPSVIGKGASSTQWALHQEFDVTLGSLAFPAQVAAVLSDPAMHTNLSRMNEICVTVPGGVVKRLDDALVAAFVTLDGPTPDPGRIGFGNALRVKCP